MTPFGEKVRGLRFGRGITLKSQGSEIAMNPVVFFPQATEPLLQLQVPPCGPWRPPGPQFESSCCCVWCAMTRSMWLSQRQL